MCTVHPSAASPTDLDELPPPAVDAWRRAGSRASHPSLRDDDEPLIVAIARGLAEVALPWELSTGEAPTERTSELLLSTDLYDAWLVHWPAGSELPLHDHDGSTGAIAVVEGVLEETVAEFGDLPLRHGRGDVVWFDGDRRHALASGDAPSTAVHVYSPPLGALGCGALGVSARGAR